MMMEGEPGTPVATRLPDEETAFVGRKVEAPRRRQRLQNAKKKRAMILGVSVVTMLAFGAVCAFLALPSESTDKVTTSAAQAMSSNAVASKSDKVFVPDFAVYDEDGDGKVSLGEYLDRAAINRDTALLHLRDAGLNDVDKDSIADLLDENFRKHSDCVSGVANEHADEMMTEENFTKIYLEITTELCPVKDDRIPDQFQVTEAAAGREELAPTNVDSDKLWDSSTEEESSKSEDESEDEANDESESESKSESEDETEKKSEDESDDESSGSSDEPSEEESSEETNDSEDASSESSDKPVWNPDKPSPPPRVVPVDDVVVRDGITDSQSGDEHLWRPNYPTPPPIPSSGNTDPVAWNPEKPTGSASVASNNESESSSSSASSESEGSTQDGIGEGQWSPDYPIAPPKTSREKDEKQDGSSSSKSNPEADTVQKPPFGERSTSGEQQTHAYNSYRRADNEGNNEYPAAETSNTYYGQNIYSRSKHQPVQESPFSEQTTGGDQWNRAYNEYSGAQTSNAYDENTFGQSNREPNQNSKTRDGWGALAGGFNLENTKRGIMHNSETRPKKNK